MIEDAPIRPWQFAAFSADTPPDAFGPFEEVVGLWRSKWHDDGTFPAWRDFDFHEFEGWWGQLAMAEIRPDPFDVYVRLWGTRLTDWWGVDYTRKSLGSMAVKPEVWEAVERGYFQDLVTNRWIGTAGGTLDAYDRMVTYVQVVDLPLESDGAVRQVLTACVRRPDETFDAIAADPVKCFESR